MEYKNRCLKFLFSPCTFLPFFEKSSIKSIFGRPVYVQVKFVYLKETENVELDRLLTTFVLVAITI